jgi:hypothetical protein
MRRRVWLHHDRAKIVEQESIAWCGPHDNAIVYWVKRGGDPHGELDPRCNGPDNDCRLESPPRHWTDRVAVENVETAL